MNFSIENFEEFVEEHILERGKACLTNEAILEMERLGDNDYVALISGTEVYTVNIVLNSKNEIFTHQCNCPYNSSPICKHKVAALLKIKAHLKKGVPIAEGKLSEIKTALNQYNKEELLQFLIDFSKSNYLIKNKILNQLGIENKDEE